MDTDDGACSPEDGPARGRPHLRWIGGIDGHLEISPDDPPQATPRFLATPEDVHAALEDPRITDLAMLRALAAFGMFLTARAVPATSQAAMLIEAMRVRAVSLRGARTGVSGVQSAINDMMDVAAQHRGVGVRQLQVRLLHEASAMLPPAP